jgi:hypothetical protein
MYPEYLVTLLAEKSFCPGAALPSFTSYSEEPCCGHHNRNIFTHKLYRRDNILELRTRCRLCYFRFCLYQRLRKLGAYSSDTGHSCTKCDRPRFLPRCTMCRVHFLRLRHKLTEEMVSGTADQLEFMMIEGHVPLEEAWKPVYDAFKRLRSQGDAGHNFKDYAIIDLEFSVYQHGSHGLAEIWQVSVIDLLGRPIAEAFIDWGESERQKAGDGFQQRIRKPEYAAMHDFYQLRTIERKSKGRLPIWTIQELGDKLKKHVNKSTTFIEWSSGGIDFNLLSKALHYFGYPDILGPKKRSLAAIPTFKAAIPGVATWKLEVVFPAWLPGSNLVGDNHHAPTDTQQLAKLLPLRFELAESPSGRHDRLCSIWPHHERRPREVSGQTKGNTNANAAANNGTTTATTATSGEKAHANANAAATGGGEEPPEVVRKMLKNMEEKGTIHSDSSFTCNCGQKWKKNWRQRNEYEEHYRSRKHRLVNPDDPYVCVCGQVMPNARQEQEQEHEKSATHFAWSAAFDRITLGLLPEFKRKYEQITSLEPEGDELIIDWRCTCWVSLCLSVSGHNGTMAYQLLKRHFQNHCSLRRFAYVRQQDIAGYICDCGVVLKAGLNGHALQLGQHKETKGHQDFLDYKDSECDECGLFVDKLIGKDKHLASRYHAFFKDLPRDARRQFLSSSPELGEIIRVRHVSRDTRKETRDTKKETRECPDCKKHI